LKRLALVSGKAELALADLGGHRAAVTIATGARAKGPIDAEDPDVVVETELATLERMLAGSLPPEDALGDDAVTVRGKRLVAMQYALALAPFYPRP
jgi:hypothetical protein